MDDIIRGLAREIGELKKSVRAARRTAEDAEAEIRKLEVKLAKITERANGKKGARRDGRKEDESGEGDEGDDEEADDDDFGV